MSRRHGRVSTKPRDGARKTRLDLLRAGLRRCSSRTESGGGTRRYACDTPRRTGEFVNYLVIWGSFRARTLNVDDPRQRIYQYRDASDQSYVGYWWHLTPYCARIEGRARSRGATALCVIGFCRFQSLAFGSHIHLSLFIRHLASNSQVTTNWNARACATGAVSITLPLPA